MSSEPPDHRPGIKSWDWAAAARERRVQRGWEMRHVARGNLVNRFRARRYLVAVITDAEGDAAGPWYLKFECVNREWIYEVMLELLRVDIDLSAIPEAEAAIVVPATQILGGFLGDNRFDVAYAAATPAWRWRLATVRRWFANRYATAPGPQQSIYEIRIGSHGGHFSHDQVGLWCELAVEEILNPVDWDPANGMLLELGVEQQMEEPVPAMMLSMRIVEEPWQSRLLALHFPAPEGEEIELDEFADL